ncbi:hypothetical protein, partial [Escherichia coli]|uniref:hypothetical protein n=1 Tax=Escherichia coli TaxID=562 RepID=UPI0022830E2B
MVRGIHWSGFGTSGHQSGQPFAQVAHGQQRASGCIGVTTAIERSRILSVAVTLDRSNLARAHHPRICSANFIQKDKQ